MQITVLGLWHLGCVTAACCARHFQVAGLDFDGEKIARLQQGKAPISEPGLDDLLAEVLAAGRLGFTTDIARACAKTDILWVCEDTPVNDQDEADVDFVLNRVRQCLPHLPAGALVLISSQLPVGSCARLQSEVQALNLEVACSPENLRLGQALGIFQNPDRVVIGAPEGPSREKLAALFKPFSDRLVWMNPASAEVTKHAINGFLALSISYANEVARLCEVMGADAREVEQGLKSESRIGPKAYLSAGGAFAGGTLARDIVFMTGLGREKELGLKLIPSVKESNDQHRHWELEHLSNLFKNPSATRIALLGLTYKPGTDTLRRSRAVELARQLEEKGFQVSAFDPLVKSLAGEPGLRMKLSASPAEALRDADAVVMCTRWPEFLELPWESLLSQMRQKQVLDAERFLDQKLKNIADCRYLCVGRVR